MNEIITKKVKVSTLKHNTGQINDVPANPRLLKDENFKKVCKSIQEDPEFLNYREIIAYDNTDGKLIVICGNQRLQALKHLKIKEATVKIMPTETKPEVIRKRMLKDNAHYGEDDWDMIANEFDEQELNESGYNVPNTFDDEPEPEPQETQDINIKIKIESQFKDIEGEVRRELEKIKEKYIYLQIK